MAFPLRTLARLPCAPLRRTALRPFSLWPATPTPTNPLPPSDLDALSTPVNLPQPPSSSTFITPDVSPLGAESGVIDPLMDLAKLPLHYGDLKAMGLGSWWPTGIVQNTLEAIHVSTGLPWWATILSLTLTLRIALFPAFLGSIRTAGAMARIQPELSALQAAMAKAKADNDPTSMQSLAIEMKNLFKKHDVNPFNALKQPLITMPVFFSMFLGIRWMAELPVPQLKLGGIPGWCEDLTMADPTYILPMTSAAATWLVAHYGANGAPHDKQSDAQIAISGIIKAVTVISIPFIGGFSIPAAVPLIGGMGLTGFPAALLLYWTCSNSFTFFQSIILRSSAVRNVLKLEPLPEKTTSVLEEEKPKSSWEALKKMVKPSMDKYAEQKKVLDASRANQQSTASRLSEKKSLSATLRERRLAEEAKRSSPTKAAAALLASRNLFEEADKEGWKQDAFKSTPTVGATATVAELEKRRAEIQERIEALQKKVQRK